MNRKQMAALRDRLKNKIVPLSESIAIIPDPQPPLTAHELEIGAQLAQHVADHPEILATEPSNASTSIEIETPPVASDKIVVSDSLMTPELANILYPETEPESKKRPERKRHYVSVSLVNGKRQGEMLYISKDEAQHVSAIGPFRTKKLAKYFANHLDIPHMQCVADAARLMREEENLNAR